MFHYTTWASLFSGFWLAIDFGVGTVINKYPSLNSFACLSIKLHPTFFCLPTGCEFGTLLQGRVLNFDSTTVGRLCSLNTITFSFHKEAASFVHWTDSHWDQLFTIGKFLWLHLKQSKTLRCVCVSLSLPFLLSHTQIIFLYR